MSKLKFKNIAFDFDGTLADSFYLAREYYDMAAKDSGIKELSREEIEKLRNKKFSIRYGFNLILSNKVSLIGLIRLGKNFLEELFFNKNRLQLFKDAPKLLSDLKMQGANIYLVTYNQKIIVDSTLERFQSKDAFKSIVQVELWKTKSNSIKSLIQDNQIDPKDIVFVGDEIRDVESAHESGIQAIAVEWGFNTPKKLKEAKPEWQVKSFKELSELLMT